MATLYGPDGFPYADGDLAVTGSANWETLSGWGNLNVVSNQVKPNTGSADGAVRLKAWSGSARFQWAQLTLFVIQNFNGPTVCSDGSGSFYFLDCRDNTSGIWFLYKVVSNTFNQMGTSVTVTGVSGDVVKIEATDDGAGGTTVIGYRNGSPVITRNDPSGSGPLSGRPGMRMWYAGASARIDDYSAGDFSVAASARTRSYVVMPQ